jgi:hypothetical protein
MVQCTLKTVRYNTHVTAYFYVIMNKISYVRTFIPVLYVRRM